MSMTSRNLIRHAPTDYSSLFVRGLPASLDAEEVRRYFCDRGYKCTVSFNKINNEYYKLYVALQFESAKVAKTIYNKYDNEQILGYNVGLSFYKDKARLYNRSDRDRDYDQRPRARVGQPIDRRRFNRTPSRSPSPRSRWRRSTRSRSHNRSRSRHSDSDRSHRSRSHSGSSSPRRRNRSSSRDRKRRSRTNSSSSRSPSSPRTSRKRSKSPKESRRRSLSPYDGSRKRHHSRQSLSPSHDATVRSVITKRTSPSPEPKVKSLVDYSHSPPSKSRRRTFSGNSSSSSSSSSDDDDDHRPSSTKWKDSPSPSRSEKAPSPARSDKSEKANSPEDKHLSSGEIPSSPVKDLPEDDVPEQTRKEKHKKHSSHHKRKKESRKRHDTSDKTDPSTEHERKSKEPPKASSLSSSIYGKVASFTDMNIQQDGSAPGGHKRKQNGKSVDDPEDVEADLRAEFLNNNDALYDSHERMQAAGFPLVSKKKEEAESILDDLPIDPLKDGHQYVSTSVEKDFTLTNGGNDMQTDANNDAWSPEMLRKLKVKKDEIIEAYKQDCDTFTTVVKMLISKDNDLETRLQNALKENLKEIGKRCVQELNQVAEQLKEETK